MTDRLEPLRRPSVSLTRCCVGPHVLKIGSTRKTLLFLFFGFLLPPGIAHVVMFE